MRAWLLSWCVRCNDIKSKEFVSLSFSNDSNVLLTQGGAPDWMLICWHW
jgi:cilia- and flagella-associated protein 57